MTSITLVNHASIIVEATDVRFMVDPWLDGSAFDNGWDLLVPTPFQYDDFHGITHIWFSHEHPDHFSPSNIRRIPEGARRAITVLFQETKDKKVIRYCDSLGFKTRELPDSQWVVIAPNFRVMVGKVPFYDSWLVMDADGQTILNLNDCVLDTVSKLDSVKRSVGRDVDVLLTQFSYAGWIGNPKDKSEREEMARQVLERVNTQSNVLTPRFVVPFASFVYFSHHENSYLNDSINTVADACLVIDDKTQAEPIALYPGDAWAVGDEHDNAPAITRWNEAVAAIPSLPRRVSSSVTVAKLSDLSKRYIERIRSKNNRLFLILMQRCGFLPTIKIRLSDIDQMMSFNLHDGLEPAAEDVKPDIEVSSEALAFVFEHEWGLDTLNVNGRFRASKESFLRVERAFSVGVLNNTGRSLGFAMFADMNFCLRALGRLLNIKLVAE